MSMRMRFVALVVGMVVLTAAWFFLGFKPASSKLTDVKAQVAATQQQIAALETKLAQLQELKRNEKELRAEAARFAKALPAQPKVSDYIRQVQQIANESGMNFVSLAPTAPVNAASAAPAPAAPAATAAPTAPDSPGGGAPTTPTTPATPAAPAVGPLKTISVSLSAVGGFFEVENFVAKLERLNRAVRIDTFDLSEAEGGDLQLGIKLQMFMQQVPAAS